MRIDREFYRFLDLGILGVNGLDRLVVQRIGGGREKPVNLVDDIARKNQDLVILAPQMCAGHLMPCGRGLHAENANHLVIDFISIAGKTSLDDPSSLARPFFK